MRFTEHYSSEENVTRMPRHYVVKQPIQSRSTQVVHRILDATILKLQEQGAAAVTTNAIAEKADVNIASLYQYFANKEMIFSAVVERALRETEGFIDRFVASAADLDIEDLVRRILSVMLQQLAPQRKVVIELFVYADLLSDASVLSLVEQRLATILRTYLSKNRDRYRVIGGDIALHVATHAGIFLFLKWLAVDSDQWSESEFIDAYVAQFCSSIEPVMGIEVATRE